MIWPISFVLPFPGGANRNDDGTCIANQYPGIVPKEIPGADIRCGFIKDTTAV